MTAAPNYVVYWLCDENCCSPQNSGYIGISKALSRRLQEHKRTGRFPDSVQVLILFSGSQDECLTLERSLRPHIGIGWNLARGGLDGHRYGLCDASRQKLSRALTGKKRKPFSAEHLANMSKANKGKRLSLETRQKMSASRIGKSTAGFFTDEVRQRMSQAKRGKTPWNKGRKGSAPWNKGKVGAQIAWNKGKAWSEETREKIGAAQRGTIRGPMSMELRAKISDAKRQKPAVPWNKGKVGLQVAPNKGKQLSPETRRKISEARRRYISATYSQNAGEPSSPA